MLPLVGGAASDNAAHCDVCSSSQSSVVSRIE